MPPPSLLQLSTAAAIRNVKYLNDIGNIPYALARPFLLKIESPEKLRTLEIQSPHIISDDDELWLELIKRDIPKWEEYELPTKSDGWYDIYRDLREQVQKSVDEDAEKMKMALDGINSERAKHSAKFVTDRRSVRLPRERPTAKQRYASYDRKMGGIAPVFATPKSGLDSGDPMGAPAWSFERPQMPRSEAPRPEVQRKKNTIFTAPKRNNVLSVPTQQLNNRATQVRQAPRALVEEHRRPVEPATVQRKESPALVVPGRSRQGGSGSGGERDAVVNPSLREREARLRALKSGTRDSQASTPSRQIPNTPQNTAESAESVPKAKPGGLDKTNDSGSDTPSAQAPRPVMVRKRPAPSVFMPPKKKRVS